MSVQEVEAAGFGDRVPLSAAALQAQARRRFRSRMVPLLRIIVLVGFFGTWEFGVRLGWFNPFLWSQPSLVAARVWQWLTDGTIAANIFVTLYEAVMGFLIGMAGGVIMGFLLGRSDLWARVFKPFIQALNAVPRLMFAPLLFVIFGLGPSSKIALGSMVIFFICFWNAFQGVRDVDRNVYNNAQMLGANRRQMTRHVLLPSAMTWIFSSLHVAIGLAITAAIVGEYLGATRGLGYIIARSQGLFDQTGVLSGLVVLSAFAVLVELTVTLAERRLWKWKPARAGEQVET